MLFEQFLKEYRIKKEFASESKDGSVKYNEDFIKKYWSEFNEKYFDGELSEIPLIWKNSKNVNGFSSWIFDAFNIKIKATKITLNPITLDTFEKFKNTLVHEMIHQYVYQTITTDMIKRANVYGKALSTKWKKYLSLTDLTAHSGLWKQKAEKLNSLDSTLKIQRIAGHDALAVRDEQGNIKQELIDKAKNAHVLVRKVNGQKYFYYVSNKVFNEIIFKMEEPAYAGQWMEYGFSPSKITSFGIKPAEEYGYVMKYKAFTWLCTEEAINRYRYRPIYLNMSDESKSYSLADE